MEIKGKTGLFISQRGKGRFYNCNITAKDKDGKVIGSKTIDLEFTKEAAPKEALEKLDPAYCYTLNIESGFLSAENYTKADGTTAHKLIIVVTKCKLEKRTEIKKPAKEETPKTSDPDLPF